MKNQLIIGMPNSGKSTYIGALRHLLVAGDVELAMEFAGFAGDEAHLNTLEKDWLSCTPMERTKVSTEAWVSLILRDRLSGEQSNFAIPDLRGEQFEGPAVRGRCSTALYESARDALGIFLFTNADRPFDMMRIDDVIDILMDDEATEQTGGEGTTIESGLFRPEDMPEEVKIIEFLQMANRRPLPPRRRKLAIAVSAWDVLPAETDPKSWLDENRPMLGQFLHNNGDLWDLRIYGISAQGGRFPDQAANLQSMDIPSKRVSIIGHGAGQHDLTAPLHWLMAQDL